MEASPFIFDVFGGQIFVEATSNGWAAFYAGNDGRRGSAHIPIPAHLDPPAIAEYLDDIFHESATADHPTVRLL